jgi:hypothetical protein
VFVQVIQGQVADAGKLKGGLDRWIQELVPGSIGWLGTTAGVTGDGRFIELARFESEDAARRNSNPPRTGPVVGRDLQAVHRGGRHLQGQQRRHRRRDRRPPMPPASSRSSRAAAATLTGRGS